MEKANKNNTSQQKDPKKRATKITNAQTKTKFKKQTKQLKTKCKRETKALKHLKREESQQRQQPTKQC